MSELMTNEHQFLSITILVLAAEMRLYIQWLLVKVTRSAAPSPPFFPELSSGR